jgi:hypothetical protein
MKATFTLSLAVLVSEKAEVISTAAKAAIVIRRVESMIILPAFGR